MSNPYIPTDELDFLQLMLTIKGKDGLPHPFVLNDCQKDFLKKKTGRDLILKARQIGFSTLIQGLIFKNTAYEIGRTAITLSKDRTSTRLLRAMFNRFYERIPDGAKPERDTNDREMTVFSKTDSRAYIGTAGADSPGRGDTVHAVHASECAFWPDPDRILPGLLEAVPEQYQVPFTSVALESTPNGASGLFYEWCMTAHEDDQREKNGQPRQGVWKLHFYAWYTEKTYRIPLLPKEVIVFEPDELALVEKYHLTPEQIKWRRWKQSQYRSSQRKFEEEHPEDPVTCFLTSGRPRFDIDSLLMRLNSQCKDPIETFEGGTIRWYARPIEGHDYVLGADSSEGINQDESCAVIRDWETNEQVATIQGNFEPILFAKLLREQAVLWNGALLATERNGSGHSVIGYLQNGTQHMPAYSRQYVHTDERLGWHTNAATRPVLIDDLAAEYLDIEGYKVRDAAIVYQAQRFVINDRGKAEAATGAKDDLIFADGIAGQMRKLPRRLLFGMVDEGFREVHDELLYA